MKKWKSTKENEITKRRETLIAEIMLRCRIISAERTCSLFKKKLNLFTYIKMITVTNIVLNKRT
jgi:hypothetical protein